MHGMSEEESLFSGGIEDWVHGSWPCLSIAPRSFFLPEIALSYLFVALPDEI
jgi:hypothetical protein